MSKAYLNFCKKTNPLASVLNKRTNSPNLTSRSPRPDNYGTDANPKLYTFCSSSNKRPAEQHPQGDENKSSINIVARERKVSLNNNLKGKTSDGRKSNPKGTTKEQIKKKFNNLSIASITTLNSAFDRRKSEKPVTARNQDKKINISVCINPKTLREFNNSLQKGKSQQKTSKYTQNNSSFFDSFKQSHNNTEVEQESAEKSKIYLNKTQLQELTHKFAEELYQKNEQIQSLKKQLQQHKRIGKKDDQERLLQDEKMEQLRQQCKVYDQQLLSCRNQMKILATDNEYYVMVRQQSKKTIKQYEKDIVGLNKTIQNLQEELMKFKQCSLLSQESRVSNQQLKTKVKMLEIENCHLKAELEINDTYQNINTISHSPQKFEDQLMIKLSEENYQLRSEIKDLYLQRIHANIYQKTIEQCAIRMTELQVQNQTLKSRFKFDCQSIKQSMQSSSFDGKIQRSQKESIGSPSEVQCVIWKRQNDQEHRGKDVQIEQFNYELFNNFHQYSQ